MTTTSHWLIRQAMLLPFFMLAEVLLGVVSPDYNSLAMQLSELSLREGWQALGFNAANLLIGLSLALFAVGVQLRSRQLRLSPLLLLIFAAAMASNGLFPMGQPMHGMMGLGLVILLIPATFAAEYAALQLGATHRWLAVMTGLLSFVYLWQGMIGLEPESLSGLFQRVVMLVNILWFAYTAHRVTRRV